MIGIIQIGAKAFADRYMYWPIVGLAIMAAWLLEDWWKLWRGMSYVKLGTAFLVILALTGLTIQHVGYWENDKTLFGRALEVTERNWLAHYTLGLYAAQHDDAHGAREHFEQTIHLMPSFPYAHVQLGQLLLNEGEAEASIPYLQHALDKNIEVERARMNLAIALAIVGRYEESLRQFSDAYEMNPHFGQPHHNLGLTLAGLHKYDDAERYLTGALRLIPEDSTIAADLTRVRNLKVLQKNE
jgi:tetratricopeptide (TPR) repeat protein